MVLSQKTPLGKDTIGQGTALSLFVAPSRGAMKFPEGATKLARALTSLAREQPVLRSQQPKELVGRDSRLS